MPETIATKNLKGKFSIITSSNSLDGQQEEQELASKALRIQNKRFYLDIKQNKRGRFVKITEVGTGGQKSRILMSMPVALEMKEKINKLSDTYSQLPSHNRESLAQDGRIASDIIVRDSRRYYLDLKENERGRFLRLAMLSMGVRVQIAIPAQGMIELRNALADLIQNYSGDTENVLFVGNKTFYFDVGSNRFGIFLRISEVRANIRSSVTIPEQHCTRFCDIITELASKMSNQKLTNGVSENGNTSDQPEETVKESIEKENGGEVPSAAS
ncbi:unnamed protein product [Trichobilharzia regenti]|nr:unnamed protein product [Trichobilharzia regenti]